MQMHLHAKSMTRYGHNWSKIGAMKCLGFANKYSHMNNFFLTEYQIDAGFYMLHLLCLLHTINARVDLQLIRD
jgi:hypothetical protein